MVASWCHERIDCPIRCAGSGSVLPQSSQASPYGRQTFPQPWHQCRKVWRFFMLHLLVLASLSPASNQAIHPQVFRLRYRLSIFRQANAPALHISSFAVCLMLASMRKAAGRHSADLVFLLPASSQSWLPPSLSTPTGIKQSRSALSNSRTALHSPKVISAAVPCALSLHATNTPPSE